ncbi:MAG: hypothetical protein ACUVS1_01605 [Actinomycetota bacterium]
MKRIKPSIRGDKDKKRTERESDAQRAPLMVTLFIFLALFAPILPGCGKADLKGELLGLLREKAGTIESLAFTCETEDGEKLYREEFHLRFPDQYRYRFFEATGREAVLLRYAAQSGNRVLRAGLEDPGPDAPLKVEFLEDVPPVRGTGIYLSLYHLMGNADYYYSQASLLEGGSLEVLSQETVEGAETYHLRSAEGLTPRTEMWLARDTGLPVRRELVLEGGRRVVFTYRDFAVNAPEPLEPFPGSAQEVADYLGRPAAPFESATRDGGCRPAEGMAEPSGAGFSPLLPELQGFGEAGSFWRDPAASDLTASEQSLKFPQGFREFYLLLREGSRQVEIRQAPLVEDFGYYTSSLGLLSGAYLVQQEKFTNDFADASYTVAFNRQEMRLVAGGLEITVTGDLSREEFQELARVFRSLAEGRE